MQNHQYTKKQLIDILDKAVNKTLGEVDTANVFDRTKTKPKITGIAGDVIENSVLGYPSDSYQAPDLVVDGIQIELKTTGIRKSKSKKSDLFEAKEPMSITAVSPERIVTEQFKNSKFWHKLNKMLLVYYHYDSNKTVTAADYANFYIKGYDFHEFSKEDIEILKNDWSIVQSFIQMLQNEYATDAPSQYPRLSSELRDKLMLIDTAPKWPHRPRFRLKRSTVTTMVQEYFGNNLESLDTNFATYQALDAELHKFTNKYNGMTIKELMTLFDIPIKLSDKTQDVSKSITEQIIVRMFGAKSNKLNKIEEFSKLGLIAKTVTQTTIGTRTEDIKFFSIDFSEFKSPKSLFEDSLIYSYFSEQQFLCILFEEPSKDSKLLDNKFLGFKRLSFSDEFIETNVKKVWSEIKYLITNNKLIDVVSYNKKGEPIINKKTGLVKSAPNFPKSSSGEIFVRGSSSDSSHKPLVINDISMYQQYIWIKGSSFLKLLNQIKFI